MEFKATLALLELNGSVEVSQLASQHAQLIESNLAQRVDLGSGLVNSQKGKKFLSLAWRVQ